MPADRYRRLRSRQQAHAELAQAVQRALRPAPSPDPSAKTPNASYTPKNATTPHHRSQIHLIKVAAGLIRSSCGWKATVKHRHGHFLLTMKALNLNQEFVLGRF